MSFFKLRIECREEFKGKKYHLTQFAGSNNHFYTLYYIPLDNFYRRSNENHIGISLDYSYDELKIETNFKKGYWEKLN